MILLVSAATVLDEAARKAPKGGEGVKAGPIGFAVILVLCVAAYFLFKSMSKHLKKVRQQFPRDEADGSGTPPGPPEPVKPVDSAAPGQPSEPPSEAVDDASAPARPPAGEGP